MGFFKGTIFNSAACKKVQDNKNTMIIFKKNDILVDINFSK
jgi:hypothetical protein